MMFLRHTLGRFEEGCRLIAQQSAWKILRMRKREVLAQFMSDLRGEDMQIPWIGEDIDWVVSDWKKIVG